MLTLWIALLAAKPAPAAVAVEPPMVTAFMSLCRPGRRTATDVLADAATTGWQGEGAERTMIAAGTTLTLRATDTENHGERLQSCGIRTTASIPTLAAALRTTLGFAPALDLGTSATFYAIGGDTGWRSGAGIDHAQFLAAKAAGEFYSIVVGEDDSGSMIYDVHAVTEPSH